MPFGLNARVLTFDSERGIIPTSKMPEWITEIAAEAQMTEDYDVSYAFGEAMARTGAGCIESYGTANESIDVWRLPDNEGWLVVHFDGEDCDVFFYIPEAAAYMEFQAQWVAPMAQKILATERYFIWRREMEQRAETAPKVH